MEVREAAASDAQAMSEVLEELIVARRRTKVGDPEFVLAHYIEHSDRLHCFLAFADDGRALGFQSLKIARDGNLYSTPTGWGIIGTHVRPSAARMGIGSLLFAKTLVGARKSGLPAIEAYIGDENRPALDFYEALGFRTYRKSDGVTCKALRLDEGVDSN